MNLALDRPLEVHRFPQAVLAYAALFPFVPSLVPQTDTQPTFLLACGVALLVALVWPPAAKRLFRLTLPAATAIALAALLIYSWLTLAHMLHGAPPLWARIVSFVQFCAAMLWASTGRFRWSRHVLLGVVAVYAVFTVVYFTTGGVLEEVLIRSREETAEFLFLTGRGARTLSPEPSFFALHMFNIFVLTRVLRVEQEMTARERLTFTALITFCMAASFSAYAVALLVVVLLASYPKFTTIALLAALAFFGGVYGLLTAREEIRGLAVLLTLIDAGSLRDALLLDASFSGRFGSLAAYLTSIRQHPLLGNGFSLYQGGGFVSIVAAFGLVAAAFFMVVLVKGLIGHYPITTKGLILVWFVLNFVSGPVGIPLLGVIVGMILTRARMPAAARQRRTLHASPVLAT